MKNGQTLTSEKKKREIVHVYVLLFAMCIVVALLTYVIPAGSYERETVDGQTIVVAGSYQLEERDPIGIFDLFNSVAKGWSQSASIIFLVFMVGGAIKVIEDTGVIDKVLTNSMGKLRGKEEGIVILVSLREPRKVCVKENKRHPFSQESEQEMNLIERKYYNGTDTEGNAESIRGQPKVQQHHRDHGRDERDVPGRIAAGDGK